MNNGKKKKDVKTCWKIMNDDTIKLNLSFSFVDLFFIVIGTILLLSMCKTICKMKKSMCIKKEAKKLVKQKENGKAQ